MNGTRKFQQQFVDWLGPQPERAAVIVARLSGYSADYVRWAGGMVGRRPWPGSRRFVRKMRALGCSSRPWRERPPQQLRAAFEHREVLHDPQEEVGL